MGYREYAVAIRKYWWILMVTLALSLGIAALVTFTAEKQYATTVTFFVKTPSDQISSAAQGDTFGQKRVNSYVQLARTDRLLAPVLAQTKSRMTKDELAAEVSASGDLNTVLLTVTVTDPSAESSMAIARSISTQFVKVVADLESGAAGGDSTVRLELVSGPQLDPAPVSPSPRLNLGLGLLIGLLVGCTLAILKEILDTSIRSSGSLERAANASVIGVIAYDATAAERPLIVEGHAKSVRAEAFRQLRTNLEFVDVDAPAKIIVITSSVANEGKSSTAANLAVIFAEAGKRVLLIEGDLRRPRVADYLSLEGSIGLTNVLAGQVSVNDVLQAWGRGGLTVLPSGSVPPNPSELLGSNQMAELLESLSTQYEMIIVDSPPLLPVTDGAILAKRAHGALLVVQHGRTTKGQVQMASAALTKVDARLLGCVLNMAPTRGAESRSYGYGYSYTDYETDESIRPSLVIKSSPPGAHAQNEIVVNDGGPRHDSVRPSKSSLT